jgi:hypothetical protein
VFRKTDDRSRALLGCSFSKREIVSIDAPWEGFAAFRGPTLHLNGNVLGYATDEDTEENQPGGTSIQVLDLSAPDDAGILVAAGPQQFARVGSLVVRRSGGVAWISCPGFRFGFGSRRPTCVEPGHTDRVYKLDAGRKKPTLLARGKRIDPSSLRLRHGFVYWMVNGDSRRARLR